MGFLEKLMGKREEEPGPVDIKGLYNENVKDIEDTRSMSDSQQMKKAIMDYQDPDNVEKREIFIFEDNRKLFPDFFLPYYWVATYHFDRGNFESAEKVLIEGIEKCRIKSILCRRLAEYYFLKNRLEPSLYWFFTAIMAGDKTMDFHSFMYLGYIFEEHDMKEASQWARRRARGIAYKLFYDAAEYSGRKRDMIKRVAASNKNEKTVCILNNFYRYAKNNIPEL